MIQRAFQVVDNDMDVQVDNEGESTFVKFEDADGFAQDRANEGDYPPYAVMLYVPGPVGFPEWRVVSVWEPDDRQTYVTDVYDSELSPL